MTRLEMMCEYYQKVAQRHKVSQCCWKDGTRRLAWAATDLGSLCEVQQGERHKTGCACPEGSNPGKQGRVYPGILQTFMKLG